jgi:peptide/nickel transport system substrate-binding protein
VHTSRPLRVAAGFAITCAVAASGCGKASSTTGNAPANRLNATTAAGLQSVDKATWAVYRDTNSIDPIYGGDYPELLPLSLTCESLLRQEPDGSIGPGLATKAKYTNARTLVITLRSGVKFWDGSPMTAADVAFSLQRQVDPKAGGYYPYSFASVNTIRATGPLKVTLKLRRPDYWLRNHLSWLPGVVLSKRAVQAEGRDYGTPRAGAKAVMCTGPYKLASWKAGDAVSLVRNDAYWNRSVKPKVRRIDIRGVPDEAAATNGLLTGAIDGYYPLALSTLDQLRQSSKVKVYTGPSYQTDAMIYSGRKGALSDPRVRQALSLALDRPGILQAVYKGAGQVARELASPGSWGYERTTFKNAWDNAGEPTVDVEAAKRLVAEAGAKGKTVVFGTSGELKNFDTDATAYRSAAQSIGLRVKMRPFSAQAYGNLFVDPKVRATVDGFFTVWYSQYGDPGGGLYSTLFLPDAPQNFSGYSNKDVTRLLEQARGTADPKQRAGLTVQAQGIISRDLPWIPNVAPDTVLIMNSKLTGALDSSSYLHAPWADQLGGKG